MRAAIDSGPLIALFNRDDLHHDRCVRFIKEFRGTLYTTVAVLTEVTHLLDFNLAAQLSFLRWVANGAIEIVDLQGEDLFTIASMTDKYGDVPMDFADASLMLIAETHHLHHIASIDRDFYIYRKQDGSYLQNIVPA